jgi:hypothetical protein
VPVLTRPGARHVLIDVGWPAPRAELLHVLKLPDFERADRIGEFWGNPKTCTFASFSSIARRIGHSGRC